MIFKRASVSLIVIILATALTVTCNDNATDSNVGFAVYGRVVWRPPLIGPPTAEFFVFNDANTVDGAVITVNNDTVPAASNESGVYRKNLLIEIGDSAYYSIESQYGSAEGVVIIPDTVSIVHPNRYDTLGTSFGYTAIWRSNWQYNGYYTYLSTQRFAICDILETPQDTSFEFPGNNMVGIGVDTFWVETLRGVFEAHYAPHEMLLPKGVVGAAGNYCQIYFTLD